MQRDSPADRHRILQLLAQQGPARKCHAYPGATVAKMLEQPKISATRNCHILLCGFMPRSAKRLPPALARLKGKGQRACPLLRPQQTAERQTWQNCWLTQGCLAHFSAKHVRNSSECYDVKMKHAKKFCLQHVWLQRQRAMATHTAMALTEICKIVELFFSPA